MFKINIHLFTADGPAAVDKLRQLGPEIFLDLKFHDIPNTVTGAVSAPLALPGVRLLDVHALGGLEMMRAAARLETKLQTGQVASAPSCLAITILTSMDNAALRRWESPGQRRDAWSNWPAWLKKAGLDGVVASPQEVAPSAAPAGRIS